VRLAREGQPLRVSRGMHQLDSDRRPSRLIERAVDGAHPTLTERVLQTVTLPQQCLGRSHNAVPSVLIEDASTPVPFPWQIVRAITGLAINTRAA